MKLTWFTLGMKEWRRRPLRTVVTAAGVALSVAAVTSVLAFLRGYQRGLRADLDRLGAHVLVVPKGCPYDAASIALHGANWPCYLREEYLAEVRTTRRIDTAAPAFMCAFPNTNGFPEVFVGVTEDMLRLKPGWRIDGRFPQAAGEVLVGAEAARRHTWSVGSRFPAPVSEGASLVVTGVLAPTGGADDGFIFLSLPEAQRMFGHHRELTHILVRLSSPDDLDEAVTQLRGCNAGMSMNVIPLTHLFRTLQSLMNSTRVWLVCVGLIALLTAAAGVANTLLMAVTERTREIGVLRSLGASRGDVARLFWIETLVLTVLGGLAGVAGAFLAGRFLDSWLRDRLPFSPKDPLIQPEVFLILGCLAGVIVLGSIAGLLPAWQAARRTPVDAIRAPKGTW